ncbi:MAG TPA: Uma2 family endonuclease [Candidatus Brocadiia bacterium]|nr:Uma2 family endonuclease [Planctomycetota bacterium]MDO8093461.1 Uma2 family endonuclease [Candidatus Brocadiales bacterium]
MASPNLKVKFTYQDYMHMPEEKRYELIEGEFFMIPSQNEYHQRISGELGFILYGFVKKNKLGSVYLAPFDVVFSDEDVVQPDIIFVSKGRKNIITKDNIKGAPDLLIEILSPKISYRDREIKRKLYFKYSVKEYWIVDPEGQNIEVLSLAEDGYKTLGIYNINTPLSSPLLKGLLIDLKEVF